MSYGQYQNNGYQAAPTAEQGYDYGQNQDHELQSYPQQPASDTLSQQDFLGRIQFLRNEIGTLTDNVRKIATIHQRLLAEPDSATVSEGLERIIAETQTLNRGIRDQLKFLANDANKTTDASRNVKERQVNTIKAEFERELRNYQEEESSHRQRYRDLIARQYRIVNPEATEDEVRQATEADWGNEGVFQTALRTNRTGQASTVLGAVRTRHNELQRIEQTLVELAAMFQDLAVLIEQHEPYVQQAEENAQNTAKYMDEGNTHVKKGIIHARNRRKWKWWCLFIVILIILVAIAIGVGVAAQNGAFKKNN
ncbi:t-SNARE [Rostrohypoxylon terebratum]|nr:t-SNARE [Rostrohypoxylon terebratum]